MKRKEQKKKGEACELGMAMSAFNASPWEAEASGFP